MHRQSEPRREHNGRFAGKCGSQFRERWHIVGRRMAILALAAVLIVPSFASGENQKNKKKSKEKDDAGIGSTLLPDNQAIDLLVSQMLGAWQAGDAEGMHKYYADDIMVVSGAWETPIIGWANYVRAYQAQFARTSGARMERTNSYTKVIGDAATITYQWQFVGNVDGRVTQAFGHTTLVMQKRAGIWVIVLNHTSAVPAEETPAGSPSSANTQPANPLGTSK
jgi:uncharacterized protein (TIGR02246 family)